MLSAGQSLARGAERLIEQLLLLPGRPAVWKLFMVPIALEN